MGGVAGEGIIFDARLGPSHHHSLALLEAQALTPSFLVPLSPSTPGPEFQINQTDANACTQCYVLMCTHSDMHREGQTCAKTHLSVCGKQTHCHL